MPMTDSPHQSARASEIRDEYMQEARKAGAPELADALATIDDAKWWIDIARNYDVDELAGVVGVGLTGDAARVHAALVAAGIDRLMVCVRSDDDGHVRIIPTAAYWRMNAIGLKMQALGEQIWDALAADGLTTRVRDRDRAVRIWVSYGAMLAHTTD